MSPLRTPRSLNEPPHVDSGEAVMRFELLEELDASVGRCEREVGAALDALRRHDAQSREGRGEGAEHRAQLLESAADVVWRLIVQHEACDCADHHLLIERLDIPAEVMARIGARH